MAQAGLWSEIKNYMGSGYDNEPTEWLDVIATKAR